jgi:hypothetical protein
MKMILDRRLILLKIITMVIKNDPISVRYDNFSEPVENNEEMIRFKTEGDN